MSIPRKHFTTFIEFLMWWLLFTLCSFSVCGLAGGLAGAWASPATFLSVLYGIFQATALVTPWGLGVLIAAPLIGLLLTGFGLLIKHFLQLRMKLAEKINLNFEENRDRKNPQGVEVSPVQVAANAASQNQAGTPVQNFGDTLKARTSQPPSTAVLQTHVNLDFQENRKSRQAVEASPVQVDTNAGSRNQVGTPIQNFGDILEINTPPSPSIPVLETHVNLDFQENRKNQQAVEASPVQVDANADSRNEEGTPIQNFDDILEINTSTSPSIPVLETQVNLDFQENRKSRQAVEASPVQVDANAGSRNEAGTPIQNFDGLLGISTPSPSTPVIGREMKESQGDASTETHILFSSPEQSSCQSWKSEKKSENSEVCRKLVFESPLENRTFQSPERVTGSKKIKIPPLQTTPLMDSDPLLFSSPENLRPVEKSF